MELLTTGILASVLFLEMAIEYSELTTAQYKPTPAMFLIMGLIYIYR